MPFDICDWGDLNQYTLHVIIETNIIPRIRVLREKPITELTVEEIKAYLELLAICLDYEILEVVIDDY